MSDLVKNHIVGFPTRRLNYVLMSISELIAHFLRVFIEPPRTKALISFAVTAKLVCVFVFA